MNKVYSNMKIKENINNYKKFKYESQNKKKYF